MKKQILLIVALVLSLSATAIAHPGRTDSEGGHHVGGTSEYHYHHGYEAHQHTGGICPYDFDDKTGENSGSSSSGSSTANPDWSPSFSAQEKKTSSLGDTLVFIFLEAPILLFGVWYLCWTAWGLFKILILEPISEAKKEKENARIREEQLRAEYQQIHSLYSGKTKIEIAKSCGMPDGFYVDENNHVHEQGCNDTPDRCIVYVASKGSVYHRNSRCCQRYLTPVNIVQVRHLNTCRYCAPDRFDLQWYDSYLEVLRLMRKHGIEPLPEVEPKQLP